MLGGTACQYIKVHLVFKQNLSYSNFFFPHFSKNPFWYRRIQFRSNNFGTSIYQVCKRPGNRRRREHWRWKTVIREINLKLSKKATKFEKTSHIYLSNSKFRTLNMYVFVFLFFRVCLRQETTTCIQNLTCVQINVLPRTNVKLKHVGDFFKHCGLLRIS